MSTSVADAVPETVAAIMTAVSEVIPVPAKEARTVKWIITSTQPMALIVVGGIAKSCGTTGAEIVRIVNTVRDTDRAAKPRAIRVRGVADSVLTRHCCGTITKRRSRGRSKSAAGA